MKRIVPSFAVAVLETLDRAVVEPSKAIEFFEIGFCVLKVFCYVYQGSLLLSINIAMSEGDPAQATRQRPARRS